LSNKSCGQCAGPLREYQHHLSSKSSGADIIDVDAISAAPEDLLGHAAPAAATVRNSVRAEETVLPQAPSAKRSRRETAEAPIHQVREKMRDDERPHVAVEESAEIVELKKALGAAKAEAHKAEALQKQLDGLKQALRDQHGEHTGALNQSKDEAPKVLQHASEEAMRAHAEQQRAFEKERERLAEQLGEADARAQQKVQTLHEQYEREAAAEKYVERNFRHPDATPATEDELKRLPKTGHWQQFARDAQFAKHHVVLTALGRGGGVRGSDTRFDREFAAQSRPPEGKKVIFMAGNVGLVGESDFFEDRSERVRKVQEEKARAAEYPKYRTLHRTWRARCSAHPVAPLRVSVYARPICHGTCRLPSILAMDIPENEIQARRKVRSRAGLACEVSALAACAHGMLALLGSRPGGSTSCVWVPGLAL
jgi:chemotaxis protein histidine kinase CheA